MAKQLTELTAKGVSCEKAALVGAFHVSSGAPKAPEPNGKVWTFRTVASTRSGSRQGRATSGDDEVSYVWTPEP